MGSAPSPHRRARRQALAHLAEVHHLVHSAQRASNLVAADVEVPRELQAEARRGALEEARGRGRLPAPSFLQAGRVQVQGLNWGAIPALADTGTRSMCKLVHLEASCHSLGTGAGQQHIRQLPGSYQPVAPCLSAPCCTNQPPTQASSAAGQHRTAAVPGARLSPPCHTS